MYPFYINSGKTGGRIAIPQPVVNAKARVLEQERVVASVRLLDQIRLLARTRTEKGAEVDGLMCEEHHEAITEAKVHISLCLNLHNNRSHHLRLVFNQQAVVVVAPRVGIENVAQPLLPISLAQPPLRFVAQLLRCETSPARIPAK